MHNDGLKPEVRKKIITFLQYLFPGAKIYLYGSRAKQTFHDRSDIDLAIDAGKAVFLGEARDVMEALAIPYKIDLVDLHVISAEFKNEIMKTAVEWT